MAKIETEAQLCKVGGLGSAGSLDGPGWSLSGMSREEAIARAPEGCPILDIAPVVNGPDAVRCVLSAPLPRFAGETPRQTAHDCVEYLSRVTGINFRDAPLAEHIAHYVRFGAILTIKGA